MTATIDHEALSNPRKALTRHQQDALLSIDFYKFQKPTRTGWEVGNKRFPATTIETLAKQGLLSRGPRSLTITQAGKLAVDKLKGKTS